MKTSYLMFLLMMLSPLVLANNIKQLEQEVWNTELAFAKTMADRDHQAFTSFLADDAIFLGNKSAARGKQAVADRWAKFFKKEKAGFAWKPEKVEVLDNGTLALSTGPVWDDIGRFHTYTSIWRKNASGQWKVIFDKGDRYCTKAKKEP